MDFKINDTGEISINKSDIETVTGVDQIKQKTISIIKSIKHDWFVDNTGADMEQLLGKPNNKETGEQGKSLIIEALVESGLLSANEINIVAFPLNRHSIAYQVNVSKRDYITFNVFFSLDISNGINIWEGEHHGII